MSEEDIAAGDGSENTGPLAGVKVLDMSRILAGPSCTQLLGDLGADVIKVERPGEGDDTRKWGPPYLQDADGEDSAESAYYLCANRNKRSIAIDVSQPEGQQLLRRLAGQCDIFIENFKVGGMAKYGLDHAALKPENPRLIYCSITGFGQDGPYASRPGYDFLIQAMGGIMSVTGEPGGQPMKVGVGIADVMTGMYAAVAILAALRHRDATGEGQHIDLALLDTQVAWLINSGLNYLTSGAPQRAMGNAHPNVAPYQLFASRDGHIVIAAGNDGQFQRLCQFAGVPELPDDQRFAHNDGRIRNRDELLPILEESIRQQDSQYWIDGLAAVNVPCGPLNNIEDVFEDPQIRHRGMEIEMTGHAVTGEQPVRLIGNPIKMSRTPVSYRRPPPVLGQHTQEVLGEMLGLDTAALAALKEHNVI